MIPRNDLHTCSSLQPHKKSAALKIRGSSALILTRSELNTGKHLVLKQRSRASSMGLKPPGRHSNQRPLCASENTSILLARVIPTL